MTQVFITIKAVTTRTNFFLSEVSKNTSDDVYNNTSDMRLVFELIQLCESILLRF